MQAVLNLKLVVELPLLTKKSGSEGLTNRGVHLSTGTKPSTLSIPLYCTSLQN